MDQTPQEQARALARSVYEGLGVRVGAPDPDVSMVLVEALAAGSIDLREAIMSDLRRGFVADCLIGNIEVVGDGLQNVKVSAGAICWRTHLGSPAFVRVLAGADPAAPLTEIDELRDEQQQVTAALMFAGITAKEIIAQIIEAHRRLDDLLAAVQGRHRALASEFIRRRMQQLLAHGRELEAIATRYRAELAPLLGIADRAVTFSREHRHDGLAVNALSFGRAELAVGPFVDVGEPPFRPIEGLRSSAGLIMIEDDGRVWIYEPRDHFGGHVHTFPKGGTGALAPTQVELQQAAIREAWEETGLVGEVTGFLTDQRRRSTHNRYYVGRRLSGDPGDAGWETHNVKLVPIAQLPEYLNRSEDLALAAMLDSRR